MKNNLKKLYQRNRSFLLFLFVLFFVRSSFADYYLIPSESMLPTLRVGDYVMVDKTAYNILVPFMGDVIKRSGSPRRGDIAVFWSPEDQMRLIKRVIGVPGDRVYVADGQAFLNGVLEQTIAKTQRLTQHLTVPDQAFVVPEGMYFVMGDNRDNSRDGRFFGLVPHRNLIGRAHHIFWSWAGVFQTGNLPFERFGKSIAFEPES